MSDHNERPQNDLMLEIQTVDFALVELSLYLNTHPDDLEAIRQYNTLAKKSQELKKEYVEKVGAFSSFGVNFSRHPFDYATSDWPWE